MTSIRLLAVDIDGTLLDPQFQISAANLEALRRAHHSGVEVALVTGRRHAFAMPIAETLGFDLVLISSNGAITKSSKGELYHRDLLPASVVGRIVRHMDEFRANCVITFEHEGPDTLLIESAAELNGSIQRWMEKNRQFIREFVPIEDGIREDPVQAMFCGTVERMKAAQARLATGDFLDEITMLRTQYDARNLCIIDILNRDCSKGHALKRWADYRGWSRDQVMAIGDNYNDVEMLEFAGIPFIMGNACAELKHNGWAVTKGNDESGVAAALAQVGL